MIGPGKYDDLCTLVREKAQADGAIVIIFKGKKGNGFSAQLDALMTLTVPDILEQIADEMRRGGGKA